MKKWRDNVHIVEVIIITFSTSPEQYILVDIHQIHCPQYWLPNCLSKSCVQKSVASAAFSVATTYLNLTTVWESWIRSTKKIAKNDQKFKQLIITNRDEEKRKVEIKPSLRDQIEANALFPRGELTSHDKQAHLCFYPL